MDSNHPGPPVIDYRSPPTSEDVPLTPAAARRRRIVWAMAVAWWSGIALSGVGSDHVRLPVAKKVAFTVAAAIVGGLLLTVPDRYRFGCAATFLIVAAWVLLMAWTWN